MLSLDRFKTHVFVATLLPVVYFILSSFFKIKAAAFLKLVMGSGVTALYLAIAQPASELAYNVYKVAAGVHLLSFGALTHETGITELIGHRRTYLVHYWMVFHVLGYFEGVRLRLPEQRSGSFYSLLHEFGTNPGFGCLEKAFAFAISTAFFFVFVLTSFKLDNVIEMVFGRQICPEGPCIFELLIFSVFARLGIFTAEAIYFYLVGELRLFEVFEE